MGTTAERSEGRGRGGMRGSTVKVQVKVQCRCTLCTMESSISPRVAPEGSPKSLLRPGGAVRFSCTAQDLTLGGEGGIGAVQWVERAVQRAMMGGCTW